MLCTDKVYITIFHWLNFGNIPDLLEIQVRWCLLFLHLEKQTGKHHKVLGGHGIGVWQVKKASYFHGHSFSIILFYFITNHLSSVEISAIL